MAGCGACRTPLRLPSWGWKTRRRVGGGRGSPRTPDLGFDGRRRRVGRDGMDLRRPSRLKALVLRLSLRGADRFSRGLQSRRERRGGRVAAPNKVPHPDPGISSIFWRYCLRPRHPPEECGHVIDAVACSSDLKAFPTCDDGQILHPKIDEGPEQITLDVWRMLPDGREDRMEQGGVSRSVVSNEPLNPHFAFQWPKSAIRGRVVCEHQFRKRPDCIRSVGRFKHGRRFYQKSGNRGVPPLVEELQGRNFRPRLIEGKSGSHPFCHICFPKTGNPGKLVR